VYFQFYLLLLVGKRFGLEIDAEHESEVVSEKKWWLEQRSTDFSKI
jgi:hypothetical protein